MKIPPTDTPELTDSAANAATGKTTRQWFKHLDDHGGLDAGRRALVQQLYSEEKLDEWWATTLVVEYERERGQKEKDGKPKGYAICVTKTIAAPLDRVYAAWTDASSLDGWLGNKTRIELEVDGTFQNADGDRGTFMRIRENKDLRFSWDHETRAPGSQVDVAFAARPKGKTGITLNHARIQDRRHADELRTGWGAAFDTLKTNLET